MIKEERENCIVDCRVSDQQQLKGGSLDDQEEIGRRFANRNGWSVLKVFKKQHSATTINRDDLEEIKDFIKANRVKGLPVHHYIFKCVDRFTRAGFPEYERRKNELESLVVQVWDAYGIIQAKKNTLEHLGDFQYPWSVYSPSESSEMLAAHQGKQEGRDILTRLIGAEIRLTQEGYKVRAATDGFKNKRIFVGGKSKMIQEPNPDRARYFFEMFNLRATGTMSDEEIVEKLNAMGYRSKVKNKWDKKHENIIGKRGGGKLTVKDFQRIIKRTIYAGIGCEKWTNYLPVKAQYDGLVSIDVFNRANRGKVFIDYKSDTDIGILYNHHPEKNVKSRMKNNPLFPYKWAVLCPECKKPFLGSVSAGKSKKGFPAYHCTRGHKRIGISKKIFDGNVERFIKSLRFDPDYLASWEATFLNKYREREKEILEDSAGINRSIADLQDEQLAKVREIAASDSAVVKRILTGEVEALDAQIEQTRGVRNQLELTEGDIKAFVRDAKEMMEHPSEMLLNAENPMTQRALFGLVFEATPTYDEIISGTPKLTWIFRLSSEFMPDKSQLVAPRRIGLLFAP